MKFSRLIPVIAASLLALIALGIWIFVSATPPLAGTAVQPEPVTASAAPADFPPGVAVAMPSPEPPPDLPPPKQPVMISPEAVKDIEDVQFMLRDFRTRLGGNPGGTNAEIMKAVMGGNPVQARLGPPQGQQLNDKGELLDRWGSPYFFHQLSANEMEVQSAGPDRTMHTSDDIVLK